MSSEEYNVLRSQELLQEHDIFLGTCSGSIIKYKKNKKEKSSVVKYPNGKHEISALSLGRSDSELLLGYNNGNITSYDINTETFEDITNCKSSHAIKVLPYSSDLLVVNKNGKLYHYHEETEKFDKIIENIDPHITFEDAVFVPQKYNLLAVGGIQNDLKIYDINSKKIHFQAKSERHDELNLRQDVSISGIEFLDVNLICSVTKQGNVRIHDPRVQRRAVMTFKNDKDMPCYTCVRNCDQPQRLLLGTNRGAVQAIDIRQSIKPAKAIKLSMGAVSEIVGTFHSYAFVYSIDRFLWIINSETLQPCFKDYLKIQATKMMVRPIFEEDLDVPVKKNKVM